MNKFLVFILVFTFSVFAFESYGTGKIVKLPDNHTIGFGKVKYVLVVKQGEQVGAMPIVENEQFKNTDYEKLVEQFVVFRGKIKTQNFEKNERKESVEIIDFVKLKKLSFDDINKGVAEINKQDPNFSLKPQPKQTKFVMSDSATQKAVLTSAALLLNDMQAAEGPQGKMRRDLTAGVLLTSGIIMMADKIKNIVKVEKDHDWELPKNTEEKKLPLTSND